MASIKYLAMAIAFFAVACSVVAIGLIVAPHAFLGHYGMPKLGTSF
jgi:hypothetical protein